MHKCMQQGGGEQRSWGVKLLAYVTFFFFLQGFKVSASCLLGKHSIPRWHLLLLLEENLMKNIPPVWKYYKLTISDLFVETWASFSVRLSTGLSKGQTLGLWLWRSVYSYFIFILTEFQAMVSRGMVLEEWAELQGTCLWISWIKH